MSYRDVLRSFIGEAGYAAVERIATELDALEARGLISSDGVTSIIVTIADEMVLEALAKEAAEVPHSPARGHAHA